MRREPVKSVDIESIGYGVFSSKLEVEFTHGEIYQYMKVPMEIYKEILSSSCYSTYFHNNIKNFYNSKKVS